MSLNINKWKVELKIKIEDFFPESLGQIHGFELYMAKYGKYFYKNYKWEILCKDFKSQ